MFWGSLNLCFLKNQNNLIVCIAYQFYPHLQQKEWLGLVVCYSGSSSFLYFHPERWQLLDPPTCHSHKFGLRIHHLDFASQPFLKLIWMKIDATQKSWTKIYLVKCLVHKFWFQWLLKHRNIWLYHLIFQIHSIVLPWKVIVKLHFSM